MRKMNTAPDPPSVRKRPESSSRWGRRPRYLPFAIVYCSFDIRENKLRGFENFFGVVCQSAVARKTSRSNISRCRQVGKRRDVGRRKPDFAIRGREKEFFSFHGLIKEEKEWVERGKKLLFRRETSFYTLHILFEHSSVDSLSPTHSIQREEEEEERVEGPPLCRANGAEA